MFWRRDRALFLPSFEPQIFQCILVVIVLTVLPHTDLKIIQKSMLIK